MNTNMKKDFIIGLRENIVIRLCRFTEGIGNWSQNKKKKPAILMAARSGSIRRVK